ncbi:MAG: amidohydrolase [Sporomusaceae bacterium]|nr:amidohydrolase [Sporomusaceae bacterium]
MSQEELKKKVCQSIDEHKEIIYSLAESIATEPEMGFKETKTSGKVAELFTKFSIPHKTGLALTGVKGLLTGKSSKRKIAVLGELDAVTCFDHPLSDPQTGAAHACGHHAQVAAMAAVAIGLKASGIMAELDGDVVPFAVPAEEYVEIEYRNRLRREGKIGYLGGKAELIRLGAFDDIDLAMMMHLSTTSDEGRNIYVGGSSNGFIGKMIRFIGREAHAAGAPEEGINALNAALIALTAVHAQRETFRDEDHVRFHPIFTKGGDLVNVIPSDVRLESYVRAKTLPAMLDANKKVDRALQAGAMAVGAQVEITDLPGFLPLINDPDLTKLFQTNAACLIGAEHVHSLTHHAASTDMGDLSHLIPVIHPWVSGVKGQAHARDFAVTDREMAYLMPAKAMAMTIIDLLYNQGETIENCLAAYKPAMTKERYLTFMNSIEKKNSGD